MKKVPIRKREFTFSSRDLTFILTVRFVNRIKKSNVPTDEVTTNLKTENGTDFRETNGKHAENHENHENGTGNTTEDKSEADADESIDLTDKVRKNCTYDYGFLFYFITDKMRRNEIIKSSVCEVSNFCSRSS